jgi:hypothetical protein
MPTHNLRLQKRLAASERQSKTSLQLFREFIFHDPVTHHTTTTILSAECFHAWASMHGRKFHGLKTTLAKTYQRAVSGHLTGSDGRNSFNQQEERAVLEEVRKKEVWPCFLDLSKAQQHGKHGYRALGFHERRRSRNASVLTLDDAPASPVVATLSLAPESHAFDRASVLYDQAVEDAFFDDQAVDDWFFDKTTVECSYNDTFADTLWAF